LGRPIEGGTHGGGEGREVKPGRGDTVLPIPVVYLDTGESNAEKITGGASKWTAQVPRHVREPSKKKRRKTRRVSKSRSQKNERENQTGKLEKRLTSDLTRRTDPEERCHGIKEMPSRRR